MEIKCRLCQSNRIKQKFKIQSYPIYSCLHCDAEFTERLSDESLIRAQEEAFDDTHFSNSVNKNVIRYWRREAKFVSRLSKEKGSVLDIGCNDGLFLSFWDQGWQKFGIELAPTVATIAEQKGIKVFQKPLEECVFEENSFDVISMYMIIEHLDDPYHSIRMISKWLKKNGILVILTGATNALKAKLKGEKWMMYTPPIHQFFFSEKSLQYLLNENGFQIERKKYTYGGMTEFKIKPLRIAEHLIGMTLAELPINQIPLYDHLYLYARKQ
ncbi:MAG: class I SAM-dependent methyltransferase [Chloroherpetonaceae bacterium]|nr:class I SAM-dependent methyltransferase [Chloroherpetonaceae bacterium]